MVINTNPVQAIGSNAGVPDFSNHQARGYVAGSESTLAPVTAHAFTGSPEFVDSKGARQLFGIVKSTLYVLKAEGKIASVAIRKRGASRAKRLWSCDSIRNFLNANMEGGVL